MFRNDKLSALVIAAIITAVMLAGASLITPGSLTYATQVHSNGMELMLSINSSSMMQGGSITVNVSLINTLHIINHVSAEHYWSIDDVSLGACDNINYPMGIAVFNGYYTSANISDVRNPLTIFRPTVCPMFIVYIREYQFYPYGSAASIKGPSMINGTYYVNSYMISREFTLSGYYAQQQEPANGSNISSHLILNQFSPGTYTIVGADEWGGFVILHFNVL
ncbi:MAG: hypothetical protein ACP5NC_00320 [Nitrososphaeria archaeon]